MLLCSKRILSVRCFLFPCWPYLSQRVVLITDLGGNLWLIKLLARNSVCFSCRETEVVRCIELSDWSVGVVFSPTIWSAGSRIQNPWKK